MQNILTPALMGFLTRPGLRRAPAYDAPRLTTRALNSRSTTSNGTSPPLKRNASAKRSAAQVRSYAKNIVERRGLKMILVIVNKTLRARCAFWKRMAEDAQALLRHALKLKSWAVANDRYGPRILKDYEQ